MKTKAGKTVPRGLAAALHTGKSMMAAWGKLRPSCQTNYVALVEKAKADPEKRKKAVAQVAKLTGKFGKRHSDERKNRGPA